MSENTVPLVGEEFVVGFRRQTEWKWLIATAFFLGKVGAGLFMLSLLLDYPLGELLGLIVAGAGKGAAHLIYLGRPERFWRIVSRPGSSWIARGFVAMILFIIFGGLTIAPDVGWLGWIAASKGGGLWWIFRVVAGLAALVVMVYDGFVMSASPAIPLWNTAFMPVLCLFYSALGGTTLTIFLNNLGLGGLAIDLATLERLEVGLILINLLMILMFILSMSGAPAAARQAMNSLVRGKYAGIFVGVVILIGLVLTLILALYLASGGHGWAAFLVAVADLLGHFFLFYALLQAGLFTPILGQMTLGRAR